MKRIDADQILLTLPVLGKGGQLHRLRQPSLFAWFLRHLLLNSVFRRGCRRGIYGHGRADLRLSLPKTRSFACAISLFRGLDNPIQWAQPTDSLSVASDLLMSLPNGENSCVIAPNKPN